MTETTIARTLVLARHARAHNDAASDEARELSVEGHADAAAIGRWLLASEFTFAAVVSSTSTRTRQTWTDIEASGVSAHEVRFDHRVYGGEADDLLAVLAESPDSVSSLLLIGHSPAIPELADQLADPSASDEAAIATLRSGFPSGSLAVLSVKGPWASLAPGNATLTEVATPRA
ncbi:MAG: histidine phosphatase family protein [Geodermatophilaceae bacterium]|nr:histidine phosphatase family protein [Geodermatophilaceae bacterium]